MPHTASPAGAQPSDPQTAYEKLVAEGRIAPDAAQAEIVARLQALFTQLKAKPRRGLLRKAANAPKSLYIWGNVGRGKSMLMDLFYQHASVKTKKRIHFHRFMQDVHAGIHQLRQGKNPGDPVVLLAQALAKETRLLCFDELQATDVADASLLFRLFEQLFASGVVIVATSNHPPETLYTGGVQRERFEKFTALLKENMDVQTLSSPHDYRLQQIKSLNKVYHHPLKDSAAFLQHVLDTVVEQKRPAPRDLQVQGRTITLQTYGESVAQASFAELCETALGPADYLAIADAFDTLILTGIPILSPEKRNEAKRFVTLIDALYEHKTHVIFAAAAAPDALYPEGHGSFEFKRTVSRLMEMQSKPYLEGLQAG